MTKVNIVKQLYYIVGMIGIFTIILTGIFQLNLYDGLAFVIYQIFMMVLPGQALLLMLNWKCKNNIENMGLSYVLGYCINIFVYYTAVLLETVELVKFLSAVIVLLSTVVVVKHRKKIEVSFDKSGNRICIVFIAVLSFFQIIVYASVNYIPDQIGESNAYYTDLLYWIGNTVSLSKEYPAINFRNYPEPFNYHYFSSIQIAVMHLLTNIQITVLSFYFAIIQPILLVVFGSYAVARRYIVKDKILLIVTMLIVLCITGFENSGEVTYVSHMYLAPFGFDYAMGIMLFIIYMLQRIIHEELHYNTVLVTWILYITLCGVKGPSAAVCLIGFAILSAYHCFKKDYKKVLLYGVIPLFVFIIIYLFVTNTQGYSGRTLTESISYSGQTSGEELKTIATRIYEFGQNIIKRTIRVNPVLYLLSLVSFCKVVICKKWDIMNGILLTIMFIGVILTTQMKMYGGSEMYFVMTAYPVASVFICKNLFVEGEKRTYRVYGIKVCTLLVMMGFGIFCLLKESSTYINMC